jgi:hypothetical protein
MCVLNTRRTFVVEKNDINFGIKAFWYTKGGSPLNKFIAQNHGFQILYFCKGCRVSQTYSWLPEIFIKAS